MQDNYPQEFDEQFISQAWLNMKQMLDKEMPVQGRRRATWWHWLLAGLLFFAALGGGGYYLLHTEKKTASGEATPTARLEQAPGQPSVQAPKRGHSASIPQDKDDAAQMNRQPAALPVPAPESAQAGLTHEAARRVEPEVAGIWPSAPAEIQELDKAMGSSIPEQGTGDENTAAVPGKEKFLSAASAEDKEWSTPLAFLPGTVGLVSSDTPETGPGKWRFFPGRKRNNLIVTMEAGAFFLGHSFVDGLSTGLGLEARPRGNRFYGRTGVFYHSYQQELETANNTLRLENSFSQISLPDGSIVNSTSILYSNTTLTQARYLQVPLLVGFQWKPRVAFEAGLQAGFLLSSTAITSWKVEETFSMPIGPEQGDNSIYGFSKGAANEAINHTSLDVLAGLAYRPGARTSFRVTYQHGLAGLLSGSTESAFIRGLRLSLAYSLFPATN